MKSCHMLRGGGSSKGCHPIHYPTAIPSSGGNHLHVDLGGLPGTVDITTNVVCLPMVMVRKEISDDMQAHPSAIFLPPPLGQPYRDMKRLRPDESALRCVKPCRAAAPVTKRPAVGDAPEEPAKRHCPFVDRETAVTQRERAVAVREATAMQREAMLLEVARTLEGWHARLRQRECDASRGVTHGLLYCS